MLLLMTGLPLSSHIWSSGEMNMVLHLPFPLSLSTKVGRNIVQGVENENRQTIAVVFFFFWQKDNSSSHRGYSSDFRQFLLSEYSNCNQSYKPLQSILMKIGVLFVFVALLSFSNKSIIQEKIFLVLFRQVNLDMDWEWELQQISFE